MKCRHIICVYTVCQSICLLIVQNEKGKAKKISYNAKEVCVRNFLSSECLLQCSVNSVTRHWPAKTAYNLGLVVRKPVFGVSDKVSFKPVSSATETS